MKGKVPSTYVPGSTQPPIQWVKRSEKLTGV